MAPWHEQVGECWLYSLADAQRRTQVAIHHAIRCVNHHHLNVTPGSNNLPKFIKLLHEDISCSVNTLMARERYDQPHELFDDRPTHMLQLRDGEAQALHLMYEFVNCVAAGLVDRPEQMPGFVFDFDLWLSGYIDVPKPKIYFGDSRPDVIRMKVTPPPLLYQAFGGDIERLVYHMQRMAREVVQKIVTARKRPALGPEGVLALHPWSEPRTLRDSGGKRVPTFRIGTGGAVGREVRVQAAEEVHQFRSEHEEARLARKNGDFEREFPHGTYNMQVHHNAPIAEEHPGAFLTKSGPTLDEVKAELQAQRQRRLRAEGEWTAAFEAEKVEAAGTEAKEKDSSAMVETRSEVVDTGASPAGEVTGEAETEATWIEATVLSPREQMIERSRALMAFVNETFEEEAEAICEYAEYVPADSSDPDESDANADVTAPGSAEQPAKPARGAPVVRHRFGRTVADEEAAKSRRLVILRDKRRGRPPGGTTRSGSDPPD
ncbi:MAG: hypothetical protein OEZ06_21055 [Myxococcales bacterium]|nr:hypothetical protein [Myxococcales bacterium]